MKVMIFSPIAIWIAAVAPFAYGQAFDAFGQAGLRQIEDRATLGFAISGGENYLGGGSGNATVSPIVEYRWASGWFAGTTNGVGYQFSSQPQVQYGVRLNLDRGRKEESAPALQGTGSIDPRVQYGAFGNFALTPQLSLNSSINVGTGTDRSGIELNLGSVYNLNFNSQWGMALSVSAVLANASHLQSYFGVTQSQSTTSGYAVYTPSAGIEAVRANASLRYRLTQNVTVLTALTVNGLQGDAKSSPLVRNAKYLGGLAAVTYSF
jgi:outer membrane scaffolding protein for murein synthesis (MipA/OmpV family)